jgi:hypothetical protein
MQRFLVLLALLGAAAAPLPPKRIALPRGFRPTALATMGNDVVVAGLNGQVVIVRDLARVSAPISAGANPVSLGVAGGLIAVANHETDYVTLIQGTAPRTLRLHSRPHPHAVAVGDFDRDGKPDLAVDSWGENRIMLLFGRDGWRGPGTPVEVGARPYWTITAADVDGDGNVDLVTPNAGTTKVSILLGDGRGHFAHAPGSPFEAGPCPFAATVADLNGDHRPDIAVANFSGHNTDTANDGLTWIRSDGARRFTPFPRRIATGNYTSRIAAGDLDGDRIDDVVFTNGNGTTATIVYGSPTGPRRTTSIATMPHPHGVAVVGGRVVVASEEEDALLVVAGR